MQIIIQAMLKFNHWPYQWNKTLSQKHKSLSSNCSSEVVEYTEHTGKVVLHNAEMPQQDFLLIWNRNRGVQLFYKNIVLALSTSSDKLIQ